MTKYGFDIKRKKQIQNIKFRGKSYGIKIIEEEKVDKIWLGLKKFQILKTSYYDDKKKVFICALQVCSI